MAGYWIVRGSSVKDEAAAKQYSQLWGTIAAKYGAEIIAGRGAVETREGVHYPRQLVIKFATFDDAVKCYEDPEYTAAMKLAHRAYDRELSILEG